MSGAPRAVEVVSEGRPVGAAPSLSIIVFAFDEEENIAAVLDELGLWLDAHEPDAEIVFVDDGSRDATSERAREALAERAHVVLRHTRNGGIGAALTAALAADPDCAMVYAGARGPVAALSAKPTCAIASRAIANACRWFMP
jgi:GT2 family glycosyltransferase